MNKFTLLLVIGSVTILIFLFNIAIVEKEAFNECYDVLINCKDTLKDCVSNYSECVSSYIELREENAKLRQENSRLKQSMKLLTYVPELRTYKLTYSTYSDLRIIGEVAREYANDSYVKTYAEIINFTDNGIFYINGERFWFRYA